MSQEHRCRVEFCGRPATHFTEREPHPRYADGRARTAAYICAWHAPQAAKPITPEHAAPPP
jgi:hypothetical protein